MKYSNWTKDLSDSVIALEKIKHTYLSKVISGKIHTIESSKNEVLILMDIKSGIDYIRENENGLQGIAARVQWGNDWNTFTIRSKRHTGTQTELEKRLYQIENGYFYPAFTMQAYFDNRKTNNLLSIGIIKTIDLYTLFKEQPKLFKTRCSDNEFVYVHWDDISEYVKQISLVKKKEAEYF